LLQEKYCIVLNGGAGVAELIVNDHPLKWLACNCTLPQF